MPVLQFPAREPVPVPEPATLYNILEVDNVADSREIRAAYKQKSLAAHPDKGGDLDKFDELNRAFKVLFDPKQRDKYDETLAKAHERSLLVEGGPTPNPNKIAVVARVKTAPTSGSKRSQKMQNSMWAGPNTFLRAIEDHVEPEERIERLWEKYKAMDIRAGKEKIRNLFTKKLSVADRQALKKRSRKNQEENKAKLQKWVDKHM